MLKRMKNLGLFSGVRDLKERFTEHWIRIEGRRKMVLENCKRVLYCDQNEVRLKSDFVVIVKGENLELKSLSNDYMAVVGDISALLFETRSNT